VVSLHCLRVYLEKSYREALDLLSEMPQILGEIGLEPTDLPDHSDAQSSGLIGLRPHSGECCCASRRSCNRAVTPPLTRRFRPRKTQQTLLPSDELPGSDAQSDSSRRHRKPSNSGRSLYDRETPRHTARLAGRPPQRGRPRQPHRRQRLRLDGFTRKLREDGVRPLIKHREFRPIDHAHNARIDGPRYRQRAMCETVFSTIKRTLGDAVRAQAGTVNFVNSFLMCVVHNTKRSLKQ